MKNRYLLAFLTVCCLASTFWAQNDTTLVIAAPDSIRKAVLSEYSLSADRGSLVFTADGLEGRAVLEINGQEESLDFKNGRATFPTDAEASGKLYLLKNDKDHYRLYHVSLLSDQSYRVRYIPLWLSIVPPLIAILLALVFREVVISLFIGVWAGAFIAGGLRVDSLYYFVLSFLKVVQKYIITALNDGGHLSVIVFSMMIGGMVAVISRNGGMAGVVLALSRYARSPQSAQFITWLLGVAIFFDDYANTLIVGNTMRSVTDRFRISREKLAYIVDSTAAPVAAVAFITTWIGAELGYIDDGLKLLNGFEAEMTPYAVFLHSLKYSFYPALTLIFILILIYTRRDFGSMYQAEVRARSEGQVSRRTTSATEEANMDDLQPVKGAPLKWYNAVIPVSLVILMTIFGLIDTGMAKTYSELGTKGIAVASQSWASVWGSLPALIGDSPGFFMKIGKLIGNSDSYVALLWASLSGVLAAVALTLGSRIMNLNDTIDSMITGFKTMLPALIILTLAWSLAATTEELHTATYLSTALRDSINPFVLPVIIFILAALISFSTGSSWSTMAILYPIAIPTAWIICQSQGLDHDISLEILLNVIAVVLAASVLGDHCSPISDTTILSSLASDCHHIDHVRTQLPYALVVGLVSVTAGGLATLLGGGWVVSILLLSASVGVLLLFVLKVGKKVEEGVGSSSGQ